MAGTNTWPVSFEISCAADDADQTSSTLDSKTADLRMTLPPRCPVKNQAANLG